MNFWGLIGTLRKFGNFAVGLFPILGTIFDFFMDRIKILLDRPAIKARWNEFVQTDRGKSLVELFQRHYWYDYSQDRLNLEDFPAEAVSALRAIFIISIALCILIPLAISGNFPSVTITEVAGKTGDAQTWSITLWMLSTAFAWGAMIAGATVSNRPLAGFLHIFAITVFGTASVFAPRSFFNLVLPLAVFTSIALTEKSLKSTGGFDYVKAVIFALVSGVPAGIYMVALSPLHQFNFGNVMLTGAILGAILSFIPLYIGRKSLVPLKALEESSKQSNVSRRVWILSTFTTLFLVNLLARSGFAEFGSQLLATNTIWYGYLWPVWYFIGVGIIFKLLKNTKLFSRAIKNTLPGFAFIPVLFIIVLAGLALTWSETIVGSFSITASEWQLKISEPFFHLYKWANPWFWKSPELSQTAQLFKWVLAFELVALVWLALKKRLNNESAASLLYFLFLSGYLIYEYNFQQFSFHRSPSHSIVLISFFAISLLWLFHRVGLKMSLDSSPLWPSKGRLPLYGAVLLFCLTELHARCALHNWGIMNSIFLVMFLGIIDVGLPYFLYIFATKRFKKLPLKISTIFSIFCLGAFLSLPTNVLDKLAMCNWSIPQLMNLWEAQNQLSLTKGLTNLPYLYLPTACIVLKSTLFATFLLLIARKVDKLEIKRKPAAILFATLAFASGLSSFTKTAVDLPILPQLKVLFNPALSELSLNANVTLIYLTAWIPTLIFAFAVAWKTKKTTMDWAFAFASAAIIHFSISSIWPNNQPFLRSSGLLDDLLILLGLFTVYLIVLAVRRMDNDTNKFRKEESAAKEKGDGKSDSKPSTPLISTKEIHAVAAIAFLAIALHANQLFSPASLVSHNVNVLEHPAKLPLKWGKNLQPNPKLHGFFNLKGPNQQISSIIWSIRKTPKGGIKEILTSLVDETLNSKAIQNFDLTGKEEWSKYYPGAIAIQSSFEIVGPKYNLPRLGMTIFLPRQDQKTEIISIISTPEKFDQYYWDIVRIVKSASENKITKPKMNIVELTSLGLK